MNAPRNRDYFAKPVQHSRDAHYYGRTGPIEPQEEPNRWSPADRGLALLLSAAFGIAALALLFPLAKWLALHAWGSVGGML